MQRVALGRDVETDRFADLGAKPPGQPLRAQLFVYIVDAARRRVFPQLVDHVADIVQQRGQHRGGRRVIGFSKGRRLQRMLELIDLAEAVATGRATNENIQKFLAQRIAHAPFLSRTGP